MLKKDRIDAVRKGIGGWCPVTEIVSTNSPSRRLACKAFERVAPRGLGERRQPREPGWMPVSREPGESWRPGYSTELAASTYSP